jgi:nicotinamidase-related amidase
VIEKTRSNAFYNTNLLQALESRGIERVVVCGISTTGAILGTCLEAADRDFHVTVVQDACYVKDAAAHQLLTCAGFFRGVKVVNSNDMIALLNLTI